jgi:hypothetical protein
VKCEKITGRMEFYILELSFRLYIDRVLMQWKRLSLLEDLIKAFVHDDEE